MGGGGSFSAGGPGKGMYSRLCKFNACAWSVMDLWIDPKYIHRYKNVLPFLHCAMNTQSLLVIMLVVLGFTFLNCEVCYHGMYFILML
jgi:hypothetical protein